MTNQKGFAVVVIPLILATIGLISTGVMANIDHEKSVAIKEGDYRRVEVESLQKKLAEYYVARKSYPIVKTDGLASQNALVEALGDLSIDLSEVSGLSYWSGDGLSYTIRYFSKNQEIVVFSQ
ncbi:MAG: hypothetical protein WCV73_02950 [Patescibacteria group bacterium]|jgi:hypothetical protein